MKHPCLLAISLLALAGCGTTSAASSSISASLSTSLSEEAVSNELSQSDVRSQYGEFSISGNEKCLSFDSEANIYTISVSSDKSTFVLSGYFEGTFVIANPANLEEYGAVEIQLNNAFLENKSSEPLFYYGLEEGFICIESLAETSNYLRSNKVVVNSESDVKLGGEGELLITSVRNSAVKGKTITLFGGVEFVIYAKGDALHGNDLFSEDSDSNYAKFTGKCALYPGEGEQAFDFVDGVGTEADPYSGSINIAEGGSFTIYGGSNVFKCNISLSIGGEVVATSVLDEPIISQSASVLTISISGSLVVNGTDYSELTSIVE
ncbi:MAG: carbohydrate-binding domain-containing protein [Bacilli bacterium]|nr:carbohydrate-binding domain-containing protein [Bacilli bacterium]